jgi:hypothetical protein
LFLNYYGRQFVGIHYFPEFFFSFQIGSKFILAGIQARKWDADGELLERLFRLRLEMERWVICHAAWPASISRVSPWV